MVVDVVGARPLGQASGATGKARQMSARRPSALSGFDVTATSGTRNRRE